MNQQQNQRISQKALRALAEMQQVIQHIEQEVQQLRVQVKPQQHIFEGPTITLFCEKHQVCLSEIDDVLVRTQQRIIQLTEQAHQFANQPAPPI